MTVSTGGATKIVKGGGLDVDKQLSVAHAMHAAEVRRLDAKRKPEEQVPCLTPQELRESYDRAVLGTAFNHAAWFDPLDGEEKTLSGDPCP